MQPSCGLINSDPGSSYFTHLISDIRAGHPKRREQSAQSDEDEEEFTRLIQFIDKYTEIATKNQAQRGFCAGMVTVLRGEDLKVRGIHNVWEAMSFVPAWISA
jgi:hypothetical protein